MEVVRIVKFGQQKSANSKNCEICTCVKKTMD